MTEDRDNNPTTASGTSASEGAEVPALAQGPELAILESGHVPATVVDAGEPITRRFVEFFTANIRNKNTRIAYANAIWRFFGWCENHNVPLERIEPVILSAYIEGLTEQYAAPTVKQHLAAIRMLFDWFVTGGLMRVNPASAVRGPKHVVKVGKTPVLDADQARHLLDSIPITAKNDPEKPDITGLRDRAIIAVMVYSFARVSAVLAMLVEDYFADGKRWAFRLHEKGGKLHKVPAHHLAEEYVDAYLDAADHADQKKAPLFQSINRRRTGLTGNPVARDSIYQMIQRRARQAGIEVQVGCHTFRATGITAYLKNDGALEHAQAIAAHESSRTTTLYDRRSDEIALEEVEKIRI